ncbi:FAD-binding domain-containing protein [Massarina eburnea CBS 473.64]|uniref:FAD-binding domain-containing protein n=1 Tax=Massarina eburnea CBS 473.64 TaxID=1395130 RepID=A0A6A6S2P7_9PLEO|nr:FAD-binding domain-containing protein [Massarina eburnea CBS 473.64]
MKVTSLFPFGAFLAGVVAQNGNDAVFEPADFNATEALLNTGFNISAIPELAELAKRSNCGSLRAVYGGTKVLSQGTSAYDAFTDAYWSIQQGSVSPQCVFKPSQALEVSAVVLIARLTKCPFAVKGGGHAAFAGASGIDDGITVSLENLKQIKVAPDQKTVDIGPGNRWVNVYTVLDKVGLGVVGGRMAPVGVPGLILGGGISFFSNKLGWACDNVVSYEVVTASGLVVTASPTSHSDLYWALRGGGNNFGIVTNFKLSAFALGKMWGGQRIYLENTFPDVLDAMYTFATAGSNSDADAAQIVSFTSSPAIGNIAIAQLHYAQPVATAKVFDAFNAISHISSSTDIRTLGDLTILMNNGSTDAAPLRQTQWDVTLRVDRDLFTFLINTFYTLFPDVADVEGGLPTISIQPITGGQLKGMQQNGGNALGLDASKGPFVVMNMSSRWTNAADDRRILSFFSNVIKLVKAEAKAKGLDNDYIYMNYASQFQDPLNSYGGANVKKLKAISSIYDPLSIFLELQPGHFKLGLGAPSSVIS